MNERNKISSYFDFLMIDFISVIISFVTSYLIKFGDFGFIHSDAWMPLLYIICLLSIVICLFSDPYSGIFKRPYYEEIIKSVLLTFYNLLAATVIFYVFKIGVVFSRQMILTMYGLYFLISLIFKCIWKKLNLAKIINIHNAKRTSLFIIGEKDKISETIENACASDFSEYEICGLFFTDDSKSTEFTGINVVNNISDLSSFAKANKVDEILLTVSPSLIPTELLDEFVSDGIAVHMSFDSLIGLSAEDRVIDTIGVYNTLSIGTYHFSFGQNLYLVIKRIIDIILSLVGILLLIPVTLVVKLSYLLSGDTARIFYRQKRIGKNGKAINIFKFRTMVPDADEKLADLLSDPELKAQWDANQKLENDPRITGIGKILRRTSIDELPQLINVLSGEMSLVGPRPLVDGELEAHDGMKLYQMVKPGITGWWGCNGRSNISYRERLELEYYYIKNFSIYLDFLCILRTFLSVLKKDGAK